MTSFMQKTSGLRSTAAFKAAPTRVSRVALRVEANKRVQKKQQVILTADLTPIGKEGKEGELMTVPIGYFRNFLLPRGYAKVASQDILEAIRKKKEDALRAKLEEKAQAQGFANALATIGKFVLKKKVGEKERIYGSVSKAEIVDAVYQQTGRKLDEDSLTVPEIKAVGTYEVSISLHPEVTGTFNVVIQREKNASGKKK